MSTTTPPPKAAYLNTEDISKTVAHALAEDIGTGDVSASLIDASTQVKATIISRENAVVCGIAWANEVFHQLDQNIVLHWHVTDGNSVSAAQPWCTLQGSARALLTGERTALNFLQTLSGTATYVREFVERLKNYSTQLLDTRKTIPGLRTAQKYAVLCGGAHNHRIGLYDAYLIKENHIAACGSIEKAIAKARQQHPDLLIEIEVENLDELEQALTTKVDRILLDNFSEADIRKAVKINQHRAKLEVSGGVSLDNIATIAATNVDFISVGALTKHVHAIDLSMQIL